jgi:hypothetical protein
MLDLLAKRAAAAVEARSLAVLLRDNSQVMIAAATGEMVHPTKVSQQRNEPATESLTFHSGETAQATANTFAR